MVHVKKCPCEYGRGKPTTEFYKIVDGKRKPQIYCYGWKDVRTDDALQCCLDCDDFVYGEQCEKDFDKYKEESMDRLESDVENLKEWPHKPCINYEDGCEEWAGCPCVYYKAENEGLEE